ncbi:hypothetical protein GGR54DRAFT_625707 [Hypoxylon sp. NC1633]|nr:hypothetical protein GGR54DRAFT_625707 [Hypoxylon sp. NC1633]
MSFNQPRTVRVPDCEWAMNKDRILDLYLGTELTLKAITETMRTENNFVATVSQYEAQLRAWRARRNLKLKEWLPIFKQLDSLPPGTHSRVRLSGRCVPERRILRARRHCKSKSASESHNQSANESTISEFTDAVVEVQDPDGIWRPHTNTVREATALQQARQSPEAPTEVESPKATEQIHTTEDEHQASEDDYFAHNSPMDIRSGLEAPDGLMLKTLRVDIPEGVSWDLHLMQSGSPISWLREPNQHSREATGHQQFFPGIFSPILPEYSIPRSLTPSLTSLPPFEWLKCLSFRTFEKSLTLGYKLHATWHETKQNVLTHSDLKHLSEVSCPY